MKKRVACIAVGGYARNYLNAMIAEALAERVELVACADPQPPADFDEAVAALGAARPTLYSNHREMLAKETGLDLVTIGTGLHLHAPMLLDALAAGCHVLLAKPAAGTIQSIDAMVAAKD
ncbi:MAG: Gfo/Idh/MocA family oxidoreductase, partial [Candidatus Marinimicrobia bacterium]|nr:Gfo/Idh/MocA family oxidoreductase [Candidatus Neomarinimicrobiota bacterium]